MTKDEFNQKKEDMAEKCNCGNFVYCTAEIMEKGELKPMSIAKLREIIENKDDFSKALPVAKITSIDENDILCCPGNWEIREFEKFSEDELVAINLYGDPVILGDKIVVLVNELSKRN